MQHKMTKAYCHMGEEDNAVIYGLNCQNLSSQEKYGIIEER